MRYLKHGNISFARIGLGTARFGTLVSREDSFDQLDYYSRCGGNIIDTARNYYSWNGDGRGVSEKTVGSWMLERGNRDKMIICTKGGTRGEGRQAQVDLSERNLIEEIKQSKEALQTDYIDLYLVHKDEPSRSVEEIIETLQRVRDEANVHILGVSNWNLERVIQANVYAHEHGYQMLEAVSTCWSIAQYTDNFWNDSTVTAMDIRTYEYILNNSMLALAFSSQAKGYFQKAVQGRINEISPFLRERVYSPENMRRLDMIRDYCTRNSVSPTAVVNGYITQNRLKGIALVACSSLEQLRDIIENCDVEIEKEFIQRFDKFEETRYE